MDTRRRCRSYLHLITTPSLTEYTHHSSEKAPYPAADELSDTFGGSLSHNALSDFLGFVLFYSFFVVVCFVFNGISVCASVSACVSCASS